MAAKYASFLNRYGYVRTKEELGVNCDFLS